MLPPDASVIGGSLSASAWQSAIDPDAAIPELVAPIRRERVRLPLASVCLYGAAIHVLLLAVFAWLDVRALTLFNVVSVAGFLLAWRLVRSSRGSFVQVQVIAQAEVMIHQALAVHFIGWDCGFQNYLLAVVPLALLNPELGRAGKVWAIAALVGGYVLLAALYAGAAPIRPLDERFVALFAEANLVGALIGSTLFSIFIARGARLAEDALDDARRRSDALLLRILPPSVLARLRRSDEVVADALEEVTILFADIVGFTPFAERRPPAEVVAFLDRLFAAFDALVAARGLEKIKTIGDAYMVAAGAPLPRPDHVEATAELALAIQAEVATFSREVPGGLQVRIGVATGPAVAGVIGRSKFAYDLWGDAVNTAARMESHGEPGRIHVTAAVAERLRGRFALTPRGQVEIKGKGPMSTFWLAALPEGAGSSR